MSQHPTVLILTPVRDAESFLDHYFRQLSRLSYPRDRISVALLEGDSRDGTYRALQERLPRLQARYRSAAVFQKHFHFTIPDGMPRWEPRIQQQRRAVLARSRNHLLFRALTDQDWVLWLDVDVVEYPPDILERLLSTGKDIVHPNCVKEYGGRSFDLNAWRDRGRLHMHDLRAEGELVPLHSVGGTMLLVRADAHRDGLVFPPFLYGRRNPRIRWYNGMGGWRALRMLIRRPFVGEIESEGLGMMAHDLGYQCWGMPKLEIRHADR